MRLQTYTTIQLKEMEAYFIEVNSALLDLIKKKTKKNLIKTGKEF